MDRRIQQEWARALRNATGHGPRASLGDLPASDLDAAYAVQAINVEAWTSLGRRVGGRKAALTTAALRARFGIAEPISGVLFEDMRLADGGVLDPARVNRPMAEAEIAFVLGADLVDPDISAEQVVAAIAGVHAAIEIGDSRIAPPPTLAGIVADNGAAACFVLADPGATVLELLPEVAVELAVNGVATASGLRTAPLGEPLETAVWLAQAGVRRGLPLRAGDVLLTGSIGPVAPLRRGDHVRVTIDGVGTCSFTFGEKA
jgi:2-keto-4-pentenoate hydratase